MYGDTTSEEVAEDPLQAGPATNAPTIMANPIPSPVSRPLTMNAVLNRRTDSVQTGI